jgi:hypothetical protein
MTQGGDGYCFHIMYKLTYKLMYINLLENKINLAISSYQQLSKPCLAEEEQALLDSLVAGLVTGNDLNN